MFVGMGVVFLFLILLIGVLKIQHKVIHKITHLQSTSTLQKSIEHPSSNKSKKTAAIMAALYEFQKQKQQNISDKG